MVLNRPVTEPPQVASIYQYRPRSVPTHIIHAEVLQSALLSESESCGRRPNAKSGKTPPNAGCATRNWKIPRRRSPPSPTRTPGSPSTTTPAPRTPSPFPARLRGEMRELTLRMMITGVCTVLLALVNVIFGAQFGGVADPGSLPVVYVVLTLVFLAVAVGICYRTIATA